MTNLVRGVRVLGPTWAAFAVTMAVVADVNRDAVWIVVLAASVAAIAAVAAGCVVATRPRLAGALLVVAALAAPTFAAVWLNVIPLLCGWVLIVRARDFGPRSSVVA